MSTQTVRRLDYIDNLRWVMIILVVGMHAAVTYSHIGGWYYSSETAPGQIPQAVLMIFEACLQSFFMGFMFFLAGYFVPVSYDRKGFLRFLGDRFIRLGVPTLLYIFVINIGMGLFLLDWYGDLNLNAAGAYLYYVKHGDWIDGSGPMWFAAALLFFSAVYALLRLVTPKPRANVTKPVAPSFVAIMAIAMTTGAVTFLVRQVAPFGTAWHNMQFCYFTQYIVLFVLGLAARRKGWLAVLPTRWGWRAFWAALIGAPLSLLAIYILNFVLQGSLDAFRGGLHWQAASWAFWEQISCALFCIGFLVVFREHCNARNRLIGFFADNGFAVYVIHPPVLVAITLAMRTLGWLPLEMFATAWLLAVIASFAVAAVLRQVPVLKRIF